MFQTLHIKEFVINSNIVKNETFNMFSKIHLINNNIPLTTLDNLFSDIFNNEFKSYLFFKKNKDFEF